MKINNRKKAVGMTEAVEKMHRQGVKRLRQLTILRAFARSGAFRRIEKILDPGRFYTFAYGVESYREPYVMYCSRGRINDALAEYRSTVPKVSAELGFLAKKSDTVTWSDSADFQAEWNIPFVYAPWWSFLWHGAMTVESATIILKMRLGDDCEVELREVTEVRAVVSPICAGLAASVR